MLFRSEPTVSRWRAAGAKFHEWSTRALASDVAPRRGESLVRLVTSFETEPAEINALVKLCAEADNIAAQAP